ncbi:MAG TPA: hypothetical protein VJR70_04290 [Stellaceae bacterium]|nr:hypothetical protein [Stellaceae bacterium]
MAKPDETDPAYQRVMALFNSIPPGPDHIERFLEKLHGPGWKERAMRAGPLTLEFGRRLLELEARIGRIERHLHPSSAPLQWEATEPLKPIASPPRK